MKVDLTQETTVESVRYEIYVKLRKEDALIAQELEADERINGFVVVSSNGAMEEFRGLRNLIVQDDKEYISEEGNTVLIDRYNLPCLRHESAKYLSDLLSQEKGHKILVSGDIFFGLTHKSSPTRADIGDVYALIKLGASGVVIDTYGQSLEKVEFAVRTIRQLFYVIDNE